MNETFKEMRPRMMSVAYRMLGSVADAEDAVQDAFLRFQLVDEVSSPEGFLVKTTIRRCIDRLRAQRRREKCIVRRAASAVVTNTSRQAEVLAESLSQAFLLMLESLTPSEMAAFVLRNVFDYAYSEIAETLGKTECHARQIFRRASSRLLHGERRFEPTFEAADRLAERFRSACHSGDLQSIEQLFAEDAETRICARHKVSTRRGVIRERKPTAQFVSRVFGPIGGDRPIRLGALNDELRDIVTLGSAMSSSPRLVGGVA